jgi:hypothetical protein
MKLFFFVRMWFFLYWYGFDIRLYCNLRVADTCVVSYKNHAHLQLCKHAHVQVLHQKNTTNNNSVSPSLHARDPPQTVWTNEVHQRITTWRLHALGPTETASV